MVLKGILKASLLTGNTMADQGGAGVDLGQSRSGAGVGISQLETGATTVQNERLKLFRHFEIEHLYPIS
jgi:hypothetical protein